MNLNQLKLGGKSQTNGVDDMPETKVVNERGEGDAIQTTEEGPGVQSGEAVVDVGAQAPVIGGAMQRPDVVVIPEGARTVDPTQHPHTMNESQDPNAGLVDANYEASKLAGSTTGKVEENPDQLGETNTTLADDQQSEQARESASTDGVNQHIMREEVEVEDVVDMVSYSSNGIPKFGIGEYQFTDGLLNLPRGEESDKFDALLKSADPRTQQIVKKIDAKAAEEFFLANHRRPIASKTNDSSIEADRTDALIGTDKFAGR